MRRIHFLASISLALFLAAGAAFAADYVAAPLSGADEVPANVSKARGNATFKVSDDGTRISYKLIVANIKNVTMSHIHVGPIGQNGPIVVFLYGPVAAAGGRKDGVLATGSFAAADLRGPLAGQPLSALISAIEAGNAYVNVHTSDGVDPANTGPGDFPGGEIRAQIRLSE